MIKITDEIRKQIDEARAKQPELGNIYWNIDTNCLGTLYHNKDYDTTFAPLDKLPNSEDVKAWNIVTIDESYLPELPYGEDELPELTNDIIVCPENKQVLVQGWVTVDYLVVDEAWRELMVTTDRYYDWQSKREEMIEKIWNRSEREYGTDWRTISRKDKTELEQEWNETVEEYIKRLEERNLMGDWEVYLEFDKDGSVYGLEFEGLLKEADIDEVTEE